MRPVQFSATLDVSALAEKPSNIKGLEPVKEYLAQVDDGLHVKVSLSDQDEPIFFTQIRNTDSGNVIDSFKTNILTPLQEWKGIAISFLSLLSSQPLLEDYSVEKLNQSLPRLFNDIKDTVEDLWWDRGVHPEQTQKKL